MVGTKRLLAGFAIVLSLLILVKSSSGLRNPSAVYCEELGYNFTTKMTPAGEIGICRFPDGSLAGAWNFLKGKAAKEYSYCRKKGYEIKTITNSEKCSHIFSEECAVCVLKNGSEVEVSKLMGLEYKEGICGDDFCVPYEEDYKSCPQDCPSGSLDMYCDGIADGKCDPDCEIGEDPDCLEGATTTVSATTTVPGREFPSVAIGVAIILLILVLVTLIIWESRRR